MSVIFLMMYNPQRLKAQSLNARFTTSLYTWQQQVNDSSSANHLRAYQLAQVNIGNLGFRGLSFHTYLNYSNDYIEKVTDDPAFRVYNCFFKLKTLGNKAEFSFGRQSIFAGVGYGNIDGIQAEYRVVNYLKLKMYAGFLAPINIAPEFDNFNKDNISWGFHLTTSKLKKVKIGLSYAQRSRETIKYLQPGEFTGTFRIDYPVPSIQQKLIGLDFIGYLNPKIQFNGRLDFNIAAEQLNRVEVGGKYILQKNFDIGVDYLYRIPFIDINSIFYVFNMNPHHEFSLFSNYRLRDLRFFLRLSSIVFNTENMQRFNSGINWRFISLSYNRRSGYPGNLDGFNTNFRIPLNQKLNCNVGLNLYSYKYKYSNTRQDNALAALFGFDYLPINNLSFQAEGQILRNERYVSDVRFFLRGNYWFFHRIQ